jgi:adenine phosphoribosyltransferase
MANARGKWEGCELSPDFKSKIVDVPGYPVAGVTFRDLTPLLADATCLSGAIRELAEFARPLRPDVVAAVDARGFILGGALAAALGCGIVPFRKEGKLPRDRLRAEFSGEYSVDVLELHRDAFASGTRVFIHDDLIALGNCARACVGLVEQAGGIVAGLGFIAELCYLQGSKKIAGYQMHSLVRYSH